MQKRNMINRIVHQLESISKVSLPPFVQILLGTILGILTYLNPILIVFAITAITRIKKFSILIIFFASGFIYTNHYFSVINDESKKIQNKEIEIVGEIIEEPRIYDYSQQLTLKAIDKTGLFFAEVEKYPTLKMGNIAKFLGTVKLVSGNEKMSEYLISKKVYYELISPKVELIDTKNKIYKNKENLIQMINSKLPEPEASLLNGIILGNDENLSKEFKDKITRAGLSHITSVSGYNFTIIYIFILKLRGIIKRTHISISSITLIIAFLYLVGTTNIPALRATIMILYIIIGDILGRRNNFMIGLLLSICLILLEHPLYIKNISMQLSYASLFGISFISPKVLSFINKRVKNQTMSENISTSISATVSTAPIIYFNFGTLALSGILTNLVVIPLIPTIYLTYLSLIVSALTSASLLTASLYYLLSTILNILVKLANLF